MSFQDKEAVAQLAWLAENLPDAARHAKWQILLAERELNLHPAIRDTATALFDDKPKIDWHTYAGHGCSSQACCVNFLLPMANKPALLSQWVDHVLGLQGAKVQPIENRAGEEWSLAFEWFPPTDYLNEADKNGKRPRGSNSTSVDAALRFEHDGKRHLLLIEWKYIESYASRRFAKEIAGDATRDKRYANIWKRPNGPIRADAPLTLQDFYLNPWYQLLRQQMLAYHTEIDPFSGYDRVTVLHISPGGNDALKAVNGAAFQDFEGATLFEVFSNLLDTRLRDRFRSITTESAFAPLIAWPDADWFPWLQARYPSLCLSEAGSAE